MSEFNFLGLLMLFVGGALLHDVPFPRFLSALLLILVGATIVRL